MAVVIWFNASIVVPGAEYPYHKDWIPVTCKLSYYAKFERNGGLTDIRLIVPSSTRTNIDERSVQGVVMEIVTPKHLAGQTISIWLDPPAVFEGGVRFKPGIVYYGKWHKEHIGKLDFKGEVVFWPVGEPGGPPFEGLPGDWPTNSGSPPSKPKR